MGPLTGKVALITGAARGQGRSHALRLAEEGADIVAVDICADIPTVPYPGATADDLQQTVKGVEEFDVRALAHQVDVRDSAGLARVVEDAVARLGHVDIVCANAGIGGMGVVWEYSDEEWQDMIDINLTGVWKTARAVVPQLIAQGTGGSIILTSSVAGRFPIANMGHYTAAKHGVTGVMRSLALELAPYNIRVNSLHPTTVDTPMVDNPTARAIFVPHMTNPTKEDAAPVMKGLNALPIPWIESRDVSNAVAFLVSDEARFITASTLWIDAGASLPFKIPHGA
ncbi:3-ketoacyl-ACP reductase [Rhodococcus sp. SC4]|nr:3-ketoacyl-ACP reductase [Rhodococcus sp. SC4]